MFLIICLILIVLLIFGIKHLCDSYDIVLWTTNFEMYFTYLFFVPAFVIFFILPFFGIEKLIILYLLGCYLLFAIIWLIINSYENNSNLLRTLIAIIVRIFFGAVTFLVLVYLLFGCVSDEEQGKDN